jgi:tRNA A37 threonylcarbamoyladenosine modification protein TsaB
VLAIETSNPSAWTLGAAWRPGVALARLSAPSVAIDAGAIALDDPHHDDLMGAIDRVCARAGAAPRDLACVGVSIGPGGFTSVRVAVTCAKMICEATGAACVPVPTHDVAVASTIATLPESWRRVGVALASKSHAQGGVESGDASIAIYERLDTPAWDPTPIEPPRVRGASALAGIASGLDVLLADRFLPQSLRDAMGSVPIHPPMFDPLVCARLAAHRLAREAIDPAALLPLYPREPEAVTKWKKLRGG